MKKTIEQLEKDSGVVLLGSPQLNKKVSQEEFRELMKKGFVFVNHQDRIKFLKDNDYPINRENLVNPDLSSKEK